MWTAEHEDYPWLVLSHPSVNWLPAARPDYWHELEDLAPPYTIE
jgi:hypothetical protein